VKKLIPFVFILCFVSVSLFAQCECDDCPLAIPAQGVVVSELTVSGSTNPILGQNGQRLRALKLHFTHNAIPQLTIRLRAPNTSSFVIITQGLGTQSIPNVTFDVCIIHCDETSNPDPGINDIFSWSNPWEPNTTYTGSYYNWTGCMNFPLGTSLNGVWTLEFEDNTPGGGGELLGWSLEFADNSGTTCIASCLQSICMANGGNINPLSQSFCEGSPGLNFNIPPDFGGNVPDPILYDYYYVVTDENGTILNYLSNPDLTTFPPGNYNICGLSVLSEDFPLLPQAGIGNNISDIQQGIDNQLYCADLSEGCRTVLIQGSGAPEILGPDTVCVNQLVTFELAGLEVSAWTQVSVTGPFSNFISSNLPFVQVSWAPGPPTRTICANYSNGCISGTICKEVTIISSIPISINGPTTVCAGQVIEYTLAPEADWDVTVTGGNLISQTQTSFQVEWFENGGDNRVTVFYDGACGITGPVILLITLTSFEPPTTLNSPETLCLLGQGQSSIPSNPSIVNYIWSGTGITIQSGQGTNVVQYTVNSPDQVEICLELETTCGNQGPICETITVEESINPGITGPTEACIGEVLTFTLDGLTAEQFVSFGVTGSLDFLQFNFPILTLSYGSGSSESEEICINFFSLCTGAEEICITVNILQTNDITISGPQVVCEGQIITYEITPPLPGGSTFELNINGGSLLSQTGSEFEVIWDNLQSGGGNTISFIIEDATCGLQEPIIFEVDIFEPPLLVIDASNNLCEGSLGNASANFENSLSNYNWFGDGIIIVNGQGSNGPISFTTAQTGFFQLCVEAESLCGLIDPVCIDINVQEPAIPDIIPVEPTCNFNFVLSSSGSSLASSNWNQVDGPSLAVLVSPNSPLTNVSVTEPGIYTFEYIEDDGICQSSNTIEVEVLSSPVLEITDFLCEAGAYQVVLDINSQANPFLVNGNPIVGNQFVSDFIPSGAPYAFTVTDNNNCESVISGSFICPCVADAGTMSDLPINACISSGDVAVGMSNNDAVQDINDIGLFVLHDNPGSILGTIFDINEDGVFSYLPVLIPGQIYYISFVVGQELNNSFNPDDPCLSVSLGQPVVFFDDPTITFGDTGPFCGDGVLEAIPSSDVTSLLWQFIDGPGPAAIQNPSLPNTTVSFSGAGVYSFQLTASNPACTISDFISLESLLLPSIANQNINCLNLDNYILSFSIIESSSNYTVSLPGILDGNEFTSDPLDPSISYSYIITDDNGCSIAFSIDPINCSCGNFAGTMSNALLLACASTNGEVTATYNQNGIVLPTNIGVFILHDNNGSTLGNIIEINDSGTFIFQAGMNAGQTYYISYVIGSELNGDIDLDDPCLQVSIGQPVTWQANPNFSLETADLICGFSGLLGLNLLNDSDEVIWTVVDFPLDNPPVLSAFTGTEISIEVSQAGSYSFQVIVSNETCLSELDFSVDFAEEPGPTDLVTECLSADWFVVSFTTQSDWTISIPGIITGDTFTSDPLPSSSTTLFNIATEDGCQTELNVGPISCNCLSSAGTMSLDTLFICESEEVINLSFNGDGTVGSFDTSLFVIHTLPGAELGVVLFLTDQLSFDIPPVLELETLYFVSNIVTSIDEDGNPDLNGSCFSISQGQPLFIYRNPVFELPSDTSICFESSIIPFPNNNGGLFSILDDQTNIDFSFESESGALFLNPAMAGVLRLLYEEINGTCTRTDSLQVTFWDRPFVAQIEISCIDDFYVVELTMAGGALPYEVNGVLLPANTFVSDPIPSNNPFSISIADGRSCSAEIISVNQNCDCDSSAGQISNPLIMLCDQEDINLNEINQAGFNIPDGYELFYFLTDQPLWNPANILIQNEGLIIPWSNDLSLETTYYLFAVVTRITDNGDPDFSDPCLASSNVLPVLWRTGVQVQIAGSVVACVGSEQIIMIQATGSLPTNIVLRNNLGEEIEVELNGNSTEISYVVPSSGQIIWEIASAESFCTAVASGTFIINAIEEEEIIFLDPPELCNNRNFGSILNLNSLLANGNEGAWSLNGTVITNGLFNADGFDPGIYAVEFSTFGFSEPCPGNSILISIEVVECLCPDLNLPDSIGFCSSEGIISLDELFNVSIAGEWSISVISGDGATPIVLNNQIDLTQLNGSFNLAFTILSELPEECPAITTTILEVERSANAGDSSFANIVCAVGDEIIALDDFLTGADAGGTWVNMQGFSVSNNIARNTLLPGTNLFTYEVGGALCPLAQGFVELILRDSLQFNASINQALCPDEESTVTIESLSASTNFTLLLNGVPREEGTVFLLSPGISTLQITDTLGCISELLEVEILAPENILIDLGEDRTIGFGSRAILVLSTNIADGQISSITWLSSGEVIQTEGRSLELIIDEDQTIQVILTTIQGCVAIAEVNLTVSQAPVYIPNAFYPKSSNRANQRFGPLSPQGIKTIESFQIFDRWGNKVWEISGIDDINEAFFWDGTFKGREAVEGVYVYKLVYTNNQSRTIVTSGEVTLLK